MQGSPTLWGPGACLPLQCQFLCPPCSIWDQPPFPHSVDGTWGEHGGRSAWSSPAPCKSSLGRKVLLGSKIQEKRGQDRMELGADGGGWTGSHQSWGPLCLPRDRPRALLYLLPGTWWCCRLLTGCWMCPPGSDSPELGQGCWGRRRPCLCSSCSRGLCTFFLPQETTSIAPPAPTLPIPPQGVPLDGPKARPLFGWGQPLPRSALGSKPMFFPCAVLHQPGNPQENRTSRAKELLPYTSSPHSVPGKVRRTGQ